MSKDSNAKIVSVIGGCRRSGRWLVPARTDMMTFFGRAVIDLRQAQTSAEELEFTCTSAFANVTFIVPEGAEVRPSGMAVLGSSKCIVPVTSTPCHLPPISVDATTIFGRLRVRTTDSDPDDTEGRRWFRRKRKPSVATEAITAAAPSTVPAAETAQPVGVEPRGFSQPTATPAISDADGATQVDPFTPGPPPESTFTPGPPPETTFTPGPPPIDDEAPLDTGPGALERSDTTNEDRSPLETVEVPASLEGTVAAEGASTST